MQNVFHNTEDIIAVGTEWLPRLRQAADQSPLRRARLCLHRDNQAAVHEMLIAFCRDSLVRPHRHFDKSESFFMLEGSVTVLVFDDGGCRISRTDLGPLGTGLPFMYRIDGPAWHALVPLSEYAVVHEVTKGPFRQDDGSFAPWAPAEGPDLARFLVSALMD